MNSTLMICNSTIDSLFVSFAVIAARAKMEGYSSLGDYKSSFSMRLSSKEHQLYLYSYLVSLLIIHLSIAFTAA